MSHEFLRVFRELNSLSSGRVGVAAVQVHDFEVWADACRRAIVLGEDLRSELVELTTSATPLGRLSAAALLARFDRQAGVAAFERLENEPGAVYHASGCTVISEPVADIARTVLSSGVLRGDSPVTAPSPITLGNIASSAIRDLVVRPASSGPLAPWPGLQGSPSPSVPAARRSLGLWAGVSLAMAVGLAALYWLSR